MVCREFLALLLLLLVSLLKMYSEQPLLLLRMLQLHQVAPQLLVRLGLVLEDYLSMLLLEVVFKVNRPTLQNRISSMERCIQYVPA